jgi:hypothetical protein
MKNLIRKNKMQKHKFIAMIHNLLLRWRPLNSYFINSKKSMGFRNRQALPLTLTISSQN